MDLKTYLREDLVRLMKRRETVGLRAVRDAISAIQNAETSYVLTPAAIGAPTEFVTGAVCFGSSERIVRDMDADEMMTLARGQVERRLEDAATLREHGQVNRALMLKAEALVLSERLDAFAA